MPTVLKDLQLGIFNLKLPQVEAGKSKVGGRQVGRLDQVVPIVVDMDGAAPGQHLLGRAAVGVGRRRNRNGRAKGNSGQAQADQVMPK